MTLTVFIKEYDEFTDEYSVGVSTGTSTFTTKLAATFMPYIATDLIDEVEELPYDLVGKTFTMKSCLICDPT